MLRKILDAQRARRKLENLPTIHIEKAANYYKAFTAPNPDYKTSIHNEAGVLVGKSTYALSPLSDRIYIFEVEITPENRRRGYATALLWYLSQTYGQPITAVKELWSASGFWSAARELGSIGLIVTMPLSVGEMDREAARWQHLRPEAERLERLIAERLTVLHEPWHVAVGRGLE